MNIENRLQSLWDLARMFGRVYLFTSDDGTYSCSIKFDSIENTVLEAKSGFSHASPVSALESAIRTAMNVVKDAGGKKDVLNNAVRLLLKEQPQ